ncbi:hypothetical protein J4573_14570 [Actinomadura barringtoniae]|uniref:Uncharacterized protein n=1 Tax=Actinomadura barringtoniae TaxID=1427535 RepID=A0A939T1U9_9ACTN|nr:hypothetical protein [Actinomadura barringtoniae]MBO2448326.1 hypothetical protein [Actinomadura barringtoniae]
MPENDDHADDAPTGPIPPIIDGPPGTMPVPVPDPEAPSIARERLVPANADANANADARRRRSVRPAEPEAHPVRTAAAVLVACLVVLFGVLVAVLLS